MIRTREEVAALLPVLAAVRLLGRPASVQALVVDALGEALTEWEDQGVTLDPVVLEMVMLTLCRLIQDFAEKADDVRATLQRISDSLDEADVDASKL